ncbi:uncharacterized protein LOC107469861 [Arachis duranensis]|uniref:Uncharacterized protein LOC107469861 n=1 Tax=Arachis duranensis TaxID=130453 RepID=A0A9C6TJR0_ARADU|nr:uncharacterized protein LOC107469861 [Arachis duranensis]
MFQNFIENEIDSKSSAELRAKFFKNIEVKREKMSSGQQQHQPLPPLKRIKTLSDRKREQKLRKIGVQANDKQNFVEKPKVAKEKGQNLKKSKVQMEASMTHSQGSTCRQEKELPSKSTAVAHKNTNEVDSRMTQDLKRKETTIEDDIEECGSLQERPTKKGKIRQFASMPIDTFLQLNNEPDGEEQLDENEGDIIEEQDKDYINPTEAENIDNTLKETTVKKTRGPTQCLKIHARQLEDREEITLDIEGEAIGPTNEVVNNLSKFLGTVARNSDFCPLIYTNWKGIKDKEAIWEYVQAKSIIPTEGKRIVLARINDNWRRYKTTIKQNHFLPYKCVNEMLKNRPKSIPESHFRKLIAYWRTEKVKKMSAQNKKNRAQQKFSHRKGPINFARIRTRLAASKENNEPPTQAEMFVETRQSTKGKSLDEDTLDVIAHLQVENKKSKESAIRAFQSIFGKEKAGRVRCHGRVTTPTLLKKNEEIATLKQQHAAEKASLEGVDFEMLAAQLGSTLGNPNNDAHEEENYVEGEIKLD